MVVFGPASALSRANGLLPVELERFSLHRIESRLLVVREHGQSFSFVGRRQLCAVGRAALADDQKSAIKKIGDEAASSDRDPFTAESRRPRRVAR